MTLLPAGIIIVSIAIIGAALALAAFFWALRGKQMSVKQINEGALVIFDEAESVGHPTDQLFKNPTQARDERTNS
jgi:nitrogen fixation-related uncharacterized protein